MPNTKSAQKALRQNVRRRNRNLKKKLEAKAAIRNYKKLLTREKPEDALKELSLVYKKLDKLAKTNVIRKGKADRLKSRLAKKLDNSRQENRKLKTNK